MANTYSQNPVREEEQKEEGGSIKETGAESRQNKLEFMYLVKPAELLSVPRGKTECQKGVMNL